MLRIMKLFGLFTLALGIFLGVLLRDGKAQIIKMAQAVPGELIIDQSISGSSTLGIVAAQKLTDTANSAYFLDPAATGDSLVTAGKVTAGSFAGDGSLLTGISGIPASLVSFFNLAACPSGWTELTAARGMYIVGLPASGTLAGTSGTALTNLESRAVGQHNHGISDPGHSHSMVMSNNSGGGLVVPEAWYNDNGSNNRTGYTSSTTIGISINNSGSVAGTNAPYIQLLACQKS